MRLRVRLTLTIAVMTAIAMGGAFFGVYEAFVGLQRRQLDEALRSIAYHEAEEAPTLRFHLSDRPGPAANDVGPLEKYGIVYDDTGRVLDITTPFDRAPPKRESFAAPLDTPFDFRFEGQHLRVLLVGIPGHPGFLVVLAAPREDLDGDEQFLARAMLLGFAFALAWTSFVAYWVAGRLTRDHVAIASVAHRVAGGDLSARVHSRSPDPELAQLARDIDEMVARLSELVDAQRRFTAHAAHELRSPLTALYGELQQALRKERDVEGYKRAIGQALAATKRLTALADDLLVLAAAEHPTATDTTLVTLRDVLDEAQRLATAHAPPRTVTIEVNGASTPSLPSRNGDLVRLFRNLLENAIRHAPDDGVVRAEARVTPSGDTEVEITDDGPGIADTDREHVFEPFYRSRSVRALAGSGLGLGIAREIARSHGGDIHLAAPRDGAGATFVVRLATSGNHGITGDPVDPTA